MALGSGRGSEWDQRLWNMVLIKAPLTDDELNGCAPWAMGLFFLCLLVAGAVKTVKYLVGH